MNTISLVILILVIVGVVALLIVLPLYLRAYNQLNQCRMEANFWCWYDWVCLRGTSSYTCPTQLFYGCGPGIERVAGYCDNNPNAPGCNCRLDEDGNLPPGCTCAYSGAGTLGTMDPSNFNALCEGYNIPTNNAPPKDS